MTRGSGELGKIYENFSGESCGCTVSPPPLSKEEGSGELPPAHLVKREEFPWNKRAVRGTNRLVV